MTKVGFLPTASTPENHQQVKLELACAKRKYDKALAKFMADPEAAALELLYQTARNQYEAQPEYAEMLRAQQARADTPEGKALQSLKHIEGPKKDAALRALLATPEHKRMLEAQVAWGNLPAAIEADRIDTELRWMAEADEKVSAAQKRLDAAESAAAKIGYSLITHSWGKEAPK